MAINYGWYNYKNPRLLLQTDTGYVDGVAEQDRNGAYIDLGKFLPIIPGMIQLPISPASGTNGGAVNGAAVYCGMATQVTPGNLNNKRCCTKS